MKLMAGPIRKLLLWFSAGCISIGIVHQQWRIINATHIQTYRAAVSLLGKPVHKTGILSCLHTTSTSAVLVCQTCWQFILMALRFLFTAASVWASKLCARKQISWVYTYIHRCWECGKGSRARTASRIAKFKFH